MNGRQRYLALLEGDPVDHLPRIPIVMRYAAEHIGSNYGEFASDHRALVRANVACAHDFGFDQLSCISDPYRETAGFGGEIEYMRDDVPRCSSPLAESKDLSLLAKPDPMISERMRDRVRAARVFNEEYGHTHSILGWVEGPAAQAADLRGVMDFLTDVIDDQPFVEDLMDLCVETAIDFALAQIRVGADTIGIGDAIASQLSPGIYETLIQPREKRIVRAVQQAGARVRLHICGNITHLLPAIADMRVDILDVDHMVDMRKARAVVGKKTVLSGNLDPVSAIHQSHPQAIRKAVQAIYDAVGNPYMVNAGCEIPSGTPKENLKALCEPIPWKE